MPREPFSLSQGLKEIIKESHAHENLLRVFVSQSDPTSSNSSAFRIIYVFLIKQMQLIFHAFIMALKPASSLVLFGLKLCNKVSSKQNAQKQMLLLLMFKVFRFVKHSHSMCVCTFPSIGALECEYLGALAFRLKEDSEMENTG